MILCLICHRCFYRVRSRQFSLIEVLLVISLIFLLIGASIPAIHTARERSKFARWTAFSSNLKTSPQLLVFYDFQPTVEELVLENRAYGFEQSGYIQKKINGTISSANWGRGRWPGKNALIFDGVQSCVKLASNNSIGYLKGDFSIYVSIKPYALSGNCVLFRLDDSNGSNWNMQLSLQNDRLRFDYRTSDKPGNVSDSSGLSARSTVFDYLFTCDVWHRIGIVYSETDRQLFLYVNGQCVQQVALPGYVYNYVGQGSLGGVALPGNTFSGLMDEFLLFNRILSAQDIIGYDAMGRP